jgi:hypothetical protein
MGGKVAGKSQIGEAVEGERSGLDIVLFWNVSGGTHNLLM